MKTTSSLIGNRTKMKTLSGILFLILLCGISLRAQDTVMLNQDGKITIKEFASFYRVCNYDFETKLPQGEFNDYYAKSGKLYASGSYLNGKRNENFTVYDTERKRLYSILNNETQIDTILIYDSRGETIQLKFNEIDNKLVFFEFIDSFKNTLVNDGNGMITYQRNGLSISGPVKDFEAHGNWEILTPDYSIKEKFKKGVFISGKGKHRNGEGFETVVSNVKYLMVNPDYFENAEKLVISDFYRKRDYPKLDSIFTPNWHRHPQSGSAFMIVEESPRFPGEKNNLVLYIQSKIVYPLEAQQNNITGTVVVSFTIDIDGQVKNPEIIESLGYGCDEIALNIIQDMPDWIPGRQREKPFPVTFKIPIKFDIITEPN
jgi:TonB family protein